MSHYPFSFLFQKANGSLIIEGPKSTTVEQGANITLTCKTSSPANITWRRFAVELESGKNGYEITKNGDTSTLHLFNVDLMKAGNVSCLIKNKSSVVEVSSVAQILVNCKSFSREFYIRHT